MSLPKMPIWKGEPYNYAHWKYDGYCIHVENGVAKTRTPHVIDLSMESFWPALHAASFESPIWGELFVRGSDASQVKSCAGGREFAVFATGHDAGCDLEAVDEWVQSRALVFAEFHPWAVDERLAPPGCEGYVLKLANRLGWYKCKEQRTLDAVVVDVVEGKGKHLGLIGALVVAVEGRVVARVGGMSDLNRVEMTHAMHAGDLRGRVVEVKYQKVGSQGKLRHPRFLRFREDKSAADCLLSQDEKLNERTG